ncbi:MAG: ATP-binding protein [Planctomycetota bacterium]
MSVVLGLVAGVALTGAIIGPVAWITARRRVASVRDAERRARRSERLAEIGAMTGGLAHEIKNPLSAIGLNAQLLAEAIDDLDTIDEPDRVRLKRRTDGLRRETERLRDTLTEFLTFAGEVRLSRAPTDVNALVDELADFFAPQADQAGVRLRTEFDPARPIATIDGPHIKQALLNLLINAVQVMAADDTDRAKELILRTITRRERDLDVVEIHVIDTGPGIPAQARANIFDPYFTTKPGGSGLGLPTTRRLVEEHTGHIDVHSDPAAGTDFVVVLPLGPASGEPPGTGA